eukprot:TRINITY_DN149_c1_g1_i1.p5 TRINITY_DN149_c1_g1~~TRINITY_DN149_c1_g1_i1.p5  ORF type:complete len:102 (-),score=0.62 TRINITY_DN149_c1_g1_i1:46-351(-)
MDYENAQKPVHIRTQSYEKCVIYKLEEISTLFVKSPSEITHIEIFGKSKSKNYDCFSQIPAGFLTLYSIVPFLVHVILHHLPPIFLCLAIRRIPLLHQHQQ